MTFSPFPETPFDQNFLASKGVWTSEQVTKEIAERQSKFDDPVEKEAASHEVRHEYAEAFGALIAQRAFAANVERSL